MGIAIVMVEKLLKSSVMMNILSAARRTAATVDDPFAWTDDDKFQSSAAPKDGCNKGEIAVSNVSGTVSILSRPEGRLQQVA